MFASNHNQNNNNNNNNNNNHNDHRHIPSMSQQLAQRNAALSRQHNHQNNNNQHINQPFNMQYIMNNQFQTTQIAQQQQQRIMAENYANTQRQIAQQMAQNVANAQRQMTQQMAQNAQQQMVMTQQMAQNAANQQYHHNMQFNQNQNENENGNSLSVSTITNQDGTHIYINRNGQNTHYLVNGNYIIQNGVIIPQNGANVRIIDNHNNNNNNNNNNAVLNDVEMEENENKNDSNNNEVNNSEHLPFRHITSEESKQEIECRICMDNFNENDIVKTLPCFHQFHNECITIWLNNHDFCPLCRHSINENALQ